MQVKYNVWRGRVVYLELDETYYVINNNNYYNSIPHMIIITIYIFLNLF